MFRLFPSDIRYPCYIYYICTLGALLPTLWIVHSVYTNGVPYDTLWDAMTSYDILWGIYCLTYDCVSRLCQWTYTVILYERWWPVMDDSERDLLIVVRLDLWERDELDLLFATMMRSWKLRRMGLSSLVTYDWWSDGRSLFPPCECLETPMIGLFVRLFWHAHPSDTWLLGLCILFEFRALRSY